MNFNNHDLDLINKYQFLSSKGKYPAGVEDALKVSYLYHYTNLGGITGILGSGSMYIGHIHDMNDKKEKIFTREKIIEEINKLNFNHEEKCDFLRTYDNKIENIYVLSVTLNDHSQALENYGDFALKLDCEKLFDSIGKKFNSRNSRNPFNRQIGFFPLKVYYEKDSFNEIYSTEHRGENFLKRIHDLLCDFLKLYRNPLRNIPFINYYFESKFQDVMVELFIISCSFKRSILYQEEELRIILMGVGKDIAPDTFFNGNPKITLPLADAPQEIIYSKKVTKESLDKVNTCIHASNFKSLKLTPTKLPY